MKVYSVVLAAALVSAVAVADTVDNPGPVTLNLLGTSVIRISSQSFSVADGTSLAANIASTGDVVISAADSVFPHAFIESPLGMLEVWLELIEDGTGVINPLTGEASTHVFIRANFGDPLPPGCNIGPVELTLSASVPYNPETGTFTIAQSGFRVEAIDSGGPCGFVAAPVLNAYLGLPTSDTNVSFATAADPIITGS